MQYEHFKEFRLRGSEYFLTYARTNLKMTPTWLVNKLSEIGGLSQWVISQETHRNGDPHLHAYIRFVERLDSINMRLFDIKYYSKNYHPNISLVGKDRFKVIKYIKKSGSWIHNFDSRPIWDRLVDDNLGDPESFLEDTLYEIGRIDNGSGYRSLRDLYDLRTKGILSRRLKIFQDNEPLETKEVKKKTGKSKLSKRFNTVERKED